VPEPDETTPTRPLVSSATYPVGPGWWLGADGRWYEPPEPPEPPGTVHQIGERKRTWQGTARWDGSGWHLLGPDELLGEQPTDASAGAQDRRPRGRTDSSLRGLSIVALLVGVINLVVGLVLIGLEFAGHAGSVNPGLEFLVFLVAPGLVVLMSLLIAAHEREAGNRTSAGPVPPWTYWRYVPALVRLPLVVVLAVAIASMTPGLDPGVKAHTFTEVGATFLGLGVLLSALATAVLLGELLDW
jgi:hypothetical protein